MRDPNYQLKLLCKRSHEGGFETRVGRERQLSAIANNGDINTHYSAPELELELEEFIEAANRVCEGKSGKTPALVVLRHRTLSASSR